MLAAWLLHTTHIDCIASRDTHATGGRLTCRVWSAQSSSGVRNCPEASASGRTVPPCTAPAAPAPGTGSTSAYTSGQPVPARRTVQSALQPDTMHACARTAAEPHAVIRPLVSGLGVSVLEVKSQAAMDKEALPTGWPTWAGAAEPLKSAKVTPAGSAASAATDRLGQGSENLVCAESAAVPTAGAKGQQAARAVQQRRYCEGERP